MSSLNYFRLVIPIMAFCGTALARPVHVPTNIVKFQEVIGKASAYGTLDICVKIGNFTLLRTRGLLLPRASINRTIRVRSKFRMSLDIRCRVRKKPAVNLPGYVADWDDGRPAPASHSVRMPWGFSGRLKCGNIEIVVDSKPLLPGKNQKERAHEK